MPLDHNSPKLTFFNKVRNSETRHNFKRQLPADSKLVQRIIARTTEKPSTEKSSLARGTEEQQSSQIAGNPRKQITTKQSSTLGGHRPLRRTSSAFLVRVLWLISFICRDNHALFGKGKLLTLL